MGMLKWMDMIQERKEEFMSGEHPDDKEEAMKLIDEFLAPILKYGRKKEQEIVKAFEAGR